MVKYRKIWSTIGEFIFIVLIAFVIRSFGYGLYRVPTGSMETTMLVGELFFADKFSVLFQKPQRGDLIAFNDPGYIYSGNPLKRLVQKYIWGPNNWTKRVIGIPGDRLLGVVEKGKPVIYLNDKKLSEVYLNKHPLVGVWNHPPEFGSLKREQIERRYTFKSFDETKGLDEQPWYTIPEERLMRRSDGSCVMRYPATPLRAMDSEKSTRRGNFWDGSDNFYIELAKDQYWVMGDNRLNSHDSRAFGPLDGACIHGKIRFRIASIDSDAPSMLFDLVKNPVRFCKKIRVGRCFEPVS